LDISIAIPDSSLSEEPTPLDKTMKIFQIARACSIFQVKTIHIYKESSGSDRDRSFLRNILRYLETPQYLRKILYPMSDDLKFAGSLSPLKIPSHIQTSEPKKIRVGDIRDGVVVSYRGKKYVNVGFEQMIPYYGKDEDGKRIIVRFKEGYPGLLIKQIEKEEISQYWGYEVKETSNLTALLSACNSSIILTSRKGKNIHKNQKYFDEISRENILVVFGSPKKGLHEILGKNLGNFVRTQVLNFFPQQATETIRLEEAILGTLAILNTLTRN
jgi:predicted SPOUT superfamily RNA methylase MTH1